MLQREEEEEHAGSYNSLQDLQLTLTRRPFFIFKGHRETTYNLKYPNLTLRNCFVDENKLTLDSSQKALLHLNPDLSKGTSKYRSLITQITSEQ